MAELVTLLNRSPTSLTASSSEAFRLHVTPGRSEVGFLRVNGEGFSLRSGSNQPILHVWRDDALGHPCLRFRVAQWEATFSVAPFDIYQNCLVIGEHRKSVDEQCLPLYRIRRYEEDVGKEAAALTGEEAALIRICHVAYNGKEATLIRLVAKIMKL